MMMEPMYTITLNDEEPSDAAMLRLWDALDAALDPPPAPAGAKGSSWCLRCGWRWDPLPRNPHPRNCPGCNSAYWDREPKLSRAGKPTAARLEAVRAKRAAINETRRITRGVRMAERLAEELGMELVPIRRKGLVNRKRGAAATPKMTITAAPAPTPSIPPTMPYRPTVPPPPGLDDLDATRKDDGR